MTYQRLSGALVSVVCCSVIIDVLLAREERDSALEDGVEHGDVEANGQAHHEDEHRQVARLLGRRPGDLLQFGPRFVDEAANTTHCGCSSVSLEGSLRESLRRRTR